MTSVDRVTNDWLVKHMRETNNKLAETSSKLSVIVDMLEMFFESWKARISEEDQNRWASFAHKKFAESSAQTALPITASDSTPPLCQNVAEEAEQFIVAIKTDIEDDEEEEEVMDDWAGGVMVPMEDFGDAEKTTPPGETPPNDSLLAYVTGNNSMYFQPDPLGPSTSSPFNRDEALGSCKRSKNNYMPESASAESWEEPGLRRKQPCASVQKTVDLCSFPIRRMAHGPSLLTQALQEQLERPTAEVFAVVLNERIAEGFAEDIDWGAAYQPPHDLLDIKGVALANDAGSPRWLAAALLRPNVPFDAPYVSQLHPLSSDDLRRAFDSLRSYRSPHVLNVVWKLLGICYPTARSVITYSTHSAYNGTDSMANILFSYPPPMRQVLNFLVVECGLLEAFRSESVDLALHELCRLFSISCQNSRAQMRRRRTGLPILRRPNKNFSDKLS